MAIPTTTTLPGGQLCVGGGTIDDLVIWLRRITGETGDETFTMMGRLVPAPGVPITLDPARRGFQVLLEDLGGGARPLVDLIAGVAPIPPGTLGTGCDRKDGWKRLVYRNLSDAIDPPVCTPGSAQGLRAVRLKDERAKGRGIAFRVAGRRATIPLPLGPLRLTLILGADPAAGLAGECATHTFTTGDCRAKRFRFRCE